MTAEPLPAVYFFCVILLTSAFQDMPSLRSFTSRKRKRFLEVLAHTASVTEAAREVGLTRAQVNQIYNQDKKFALSWWSAIDEAVDVLELEARRRALEGTEEPVLYHGKECARIRRYSDSLLMALLKAERPDKYKDRVTSELSGELRGGVLAVPQTLDPAAWAEITMEYQRRLASGDGR